MSRGKINIIGLGPGSIDQLTYGAIQKIKGDNKKFLRTKVHPTVEYFDDNNIEYISFDDYYEEEDTFDDLYQKIANTLIEKLSEYDEIDYFVPGNPMIAEKTVEILINNDNIQTQIISGMSFIEPMLELIGRDPINGLKIIDGSDFKKTLLNINMDIIITQTYNNRILGDIKLISSEIYSDDYEIYIVDAAGVEGKEKIEKIPIYMLDRIDYVGPLTSIFIPRVDQIDKEIFDFNDVVDIMDILRGENGCPWDIEQTHESIRKNVIEEAYELVNAIDNDDYDNIIEELGDVLFQVVFHAKIGSDEGYFDLHEVTTELVRKLKYRHPHIFSENKVVNSEKVVYNWDRMKDSQVNYKSKTEKMENITNSLPQLLKSYKIQKIAKEVGFDWDDVSGPIEKLSEETEELLEAIESNNVANIEEELGDLLFTIVNIARFLDVDPEVSLNKANKKFIERFSLVEKMSLDNNESLEDMNLEKLNKYWNLAKNNI